TRDVEEARAAVIRIVGGYPRLQQCQLQDVATIEWKVGERASSYRGSERGINCFHHGRLFFYFDNLRQGANLQLGVDAQHLVDLQDLVLVGNLAKTIRFDHYVVAPDRKVRSLEVPFAVACSVV